MKNILCSLSTRSHLFKARALFESAQKYQSGLECRLLVVDAESAEEASASLPMNDFFRVHSCSEMESDPDFREIRDKYADRNPDAYRWALKGVYMKYLLQNEADRLIYCDNDIYFFDSCGFIFDLLSEHHVLLSPHYRAMYPHEYPREYQLDYTDGQFNGGFIACSKAGNPALEWWIRACKAHCRKDPEQGLYVDQRYLEFMHTRFPGTAILGHPGCNVAVWNTRDCRRSVVNGKIRINDEWPLVFVHFTEGTFNGIYHWERDRILTSCAQQYERHLQQYNPAFSIDKEKHISFGKRLAWEVRYKLGRLRNGLNPFN